MLKIYIISTLLCFLFYVLSLIRVKAMLRANDITIPKNKIMLESFVSIIRTMAIFSLPIINIIFALIFINMFLFYSDERLLKEIKKKL